MSKAIEAAAWLVFLVIVGAVLTGAYLVWRKEYTVEELKAIVYGMSRKEKEKE
jgi:hypothetical protein